MPRRTILSDAELAGLLALPDTEPELIRCYTFSDADVAIISQHRGPANRLGLAVLALQQRQRKEGRQQAAAGRLVRDLAVLQRAVDIPGDLLRKSVAGSIVCAKKLGGQHRQRVAEARQVRLSIDLLLGG